MWKTSSAKAIALLVVCFSWNLLSENYEFVDIPHHAVHLIWGTNRDNVHGYRKITALLLWKSETTFLQIRVKYFSFS